MTGNSLGWVVYGALKLDVYCFVSSAPGLVISCWLNLTAAKLIYQEHARQKFRASISKVVEHSIQFRSSITSTSIQIDDKFDLDHGESNSDVDVVALEPSLGFAKLWEQTLLLITLEKAPVEHEYLVVSIVAFWSILLAFVTFIPMSNDTRVFIVGLVVNVNLVFFYGGLAEGSPLMLAHSEI